MNDQTPKPTASTKHASSPNKGAALVRILVTMVVMLLSLAVLAVTIPWAAYRYRNVVIGEAAVKGTVTKIGARLEGRIKNIEVQTGQHVSKGQVLLTLDDGHFLAEVERARAQLQSATSDLVSEKLGIEQARRRLSLEIKRVQGNRTAAAGAVEAEKRNLERLQIQYGRIAKLITSGAAAPSEMDRAAGDRDRSIALSQGAQGTLDAAEISYEKAQNELEGVAVRESHLDVLNSQIAAARAQVAAAEADLEATVIKEPEDGWVLDRIVEVGRSAKVGEPMLSLWTGRAWVQAWADERDLRRFQVGSAVEIALDASPSHKLSGRVEAFGLESDKQLQPAAVPATLHTFVRQNAMVPVRIALDDEISSIQLGLSAVVGIRRASTLPHSGSMSQPSFPPNLPKLARTSPSQ